jgi:uncharacterized delta-60 repeat protein
MRAASVSSGKALAGLAFASICLASVLGLPAWAAPARLLARAELPQAGAGVHNLRVLRDGGVMAIGATPGPGGDRDMALWKLTPGLKLDGGFGQGGLVRLGGSKDDQAADAIERLDAAGHTVGLLVLGQVRAADGDFAGHAFHGGSDLALVGLTPSGALDPGYGAGGVTLMGGAGDEEVVVHLNNFSEPGLRLARRDGAIYLAAMTTSTDGDFLAAATLGRAKSRDALVMRLDAAGRLDPTFGTAGVLRLGTDPQPDTKLRGPNDFLFSLTTTAQGIYAGGYTLGVGLAQGDHVSPARGNMATPPDAACQGPGRGKYCYRMDGMLLRLRPDGGLDPAWGDHGVRFVGGSGQEKLYGIDVDERGRMVFLGRTSSHDLDLKAAAGGASGFSNFIGRLTPDGALDPTFGSGGIATFATDQNLKGARILACGPGRYTALLHSERSDDDEEVAADTGESLTVLFLDDHGRVADRLTISGVGKATGLAAMRDGDLAIAGRSSAGRKEPHAVVALVRPPSGWRCPVLP